MRRENGKGKASTERWSCRARWPGAGLVAGLFPPQEQSWGLDPQAGVTPQAAERVCRESAQQPFDGAGRNINADWDTTYDGKQMERWSEHYGERVADAQEAERREYTKGKHPEGPDNPPELLVVGMDGGRVQEREKDQATQSRWHEDKVATISSYQRKPAEEPGGDPEPVRLVTTYVATMQSSERFGQLARIEAERRGIRQAQEVVVIGDGAAWIDTEADKHFGCHERIIDYYHVAERLEGSAKAAVPADEAKRKRLGERLKSHLYKGQAPLIIRWMERQTRIFGPVRPSDPDGHPRRVLWENLTYLKRHQGQMDYPRYRSRGWPIGSGVTESGVKLFNKRVKGTEQFWNEKGVESILALRALWLSQDRRWQHYWLCGHLPRKAA
jgi:hypothetical protein